MVLFVFILVALIITFWYIAIAIVVIFGIYKYYEKPKPISNKVQTQKPIVKKAQTQKPIVKEVKKAKKRIYPIHICEHCGTENKMYPNRKLCKNCRMPLNYKKGRRWY